MASGEIKRPNVSRNTNLAYVHQSQTGVTQNCIYKTMKNVSLLVLFILTVYVTLIVVLLKLFFKKGLFYPRDKHIWIPDVKYKNIMLDGINMWYFDSFPGQPTILYCHGTSGNISYQKNVVRLAHRLGLNLILFDYYGYGSSIGKPSQDNLFKSGEIVYNFLLNSARTRIFVWGESLGGAVAVHLAAKYNIDCLILLATFASLDILAKGHPRSWLVQLLGRSLPYVTQPLRSCDLISKVKCPTIILHSQTDDLIPFDNAQILYDNIDHKDKKLVPIQGFHASPLISMNDVSQLLEMMKLPVPKVDVSDILRDIHEKSPFRSRVGS